MYYESHVELQVNSLINCTNSIHKYMFWIVNQYSSTTDKPEIYSKLETYVAQTQVLIYRITGIFWGWKFLRFGPQNVAF